MTQLLFVVDRKRPDVYESLNRSLATVDDVRVIQDRRQPGRAPAVAPAASPDQERRSREIDADLCAVGFAVVTGTRADAPVPASTDRIASFLANVRLFREFTLPDLRALSGRVSERELGRHQVLCREGDPGNAMFVVRRGTLIISKAVTGQMEKVLSRMTPGDFFGEMSLFSSMPRAATVQADTEASVLILDREALQHLIEVNPRGAFALFRAMVEEFVERLRHTDDLVAEVTRWGLEATGLAADED